MFDHRREVPPEWQHLLETIVPRHERLSWLQIVWQAGLSPKDTNTDEHVVQRWEIYECFSPEFLSPEILTELRGPDPRTLGEFIYDRDHPEASRRVWNSWCNISRCQWDIFQKSGCGSQRFWIIQGTHGGHVWTLSRTEKSFLSAMCLVYDTPMPGDLCYAEFTDVTLKKVIELDRLRKWRHELDWTDRTKKSQAGLWLTRDHNAEETEWNERMLKHLTNEVEEVVSDMPRTIVNKMMNNPKAPRGLYDVGHDEDALDQELIDHAL